MKIIKKKKKEFEAVNFDVSIETEIELENTQYDIENMLMNPIHLNKETIELLKGIQNQLFNQ